jgi:NAD(P)-dependent dehydrogenase (short-subunit alcohol dehydrogenase family)
MANFVVTGAGSGIGAATAQRLAHGGDHTVVGIDLSGADIAADLSDDDGRKLAIGEATAACGGEIHGVVCCAGLGPLSSHPGGKLVAVNYFGAVEVLRGLRPAMQRAGNASAVAISSSSTTTQPMIPAELVTACLSGTEQDAIALGDALGAIAAYPATKLALARWIRREAVSENWIGSGVRLNAVAPGMIDTPMTSGEGVNPELAKALDFYPIPMGRRGRPQEVAALIEFLLGPGSSLLCGSVVFADGGTDALLRQDDWPAAWEPTPDELTRAFVRH